MDTCLKVESQVLYFRIIWFQTYKVFGNQIVREDGQVHINSETGFSSQDL